MRRLSIVLAATVLAACGADEEQAGAPAPQSGATELNVEVTGAASAPIRMRLACGGDCKLDRLTEALRSDPTRACTQQYGGPERAHVTGTLNGRAVDVTLARSDGCGIAAYEALFTAFGRTPPLAG